MIICIAGLSGCGKNTVGNLVAKKLGLRIVDPTFKTIAAKQNMPLMEFHRKAEDKHSIDKQFDAALLQETEAGNCVATTWLSPWIVKNADLRVWLYAPQEIRAERVAKRDKMTVPQALAHINERDSANRKRYLDVYGIDIFDHSGFGLSINTGKSKPEESAKIIVAAAKSRGANKKPTNKKSKAAKK
jgi:cytidylate kinase